MPTYTRQFGANLPGFTAIRLIDIDVIDTINVTNPLVLNTAVPITLKVLASSAQLNGIYNFKQINDGKLGYNTSLTEAGIMHSYELAFQYAKHRVELTDFVQKSASKKFVAVIADSNMNIVIVGTKSQPVLISPQMDSDPGNYNFEGQCESTILPIFTTGFTYLALFGATYTAGFLSPFGIYE